MAEVGNLTAKLTLDTDGFSQGVKEAQNETNIFADLLSANLATKAIGMAVEALERLGKAAADTFKDAIAGYAEYEQLIGGSKLVFGDAYDYIMDKSEDAYKTVQMSQNEYLKQVNGFAVGLKESLGGNEQAAAELADKIVTAEADVVAAMGITQESAQNAFNGIMKGNYTMVDNLMLGIKPTKEGFQEMIDKVNDWNTAQGNATHYTMDNLADMQSALVDYINMQGLAGHASKEASGTISGSISQVKAAWSNLINNLGNDKANIKELTQDLTDSLKNAWENIKPVAKEIIDNMLEAARGMFPKILELGIDIGKEIANGLLKGLATILMLPALGVLKLLDMITGGSVGNLMTGRASGGPVQAGVPYMTGELGPELFVPATNGYILNSDDTEDYLSNRGGVTININGDVYDNARSMKQKMRTAVLGIMQEQVAYG